MRFDKVCRVTGRALAFGAGLCLAAGVFAGAQALAETGSTTTTAAADTQVSLAIEPESGYQDAVLQLAVRAISNRPGDPYFAPSDAVTP